MRFEQLQIDVGFFAARLDGGFRRPGRALRRMACRDLRADLKAARGRCKGRWPRGCRSGCAAELRLHAQNCLVRDALRCPAPSGMRRRRSPGAPGHTGACVAQSAPKQTSATSGLIESKCPSQTVVCSRSSPVPQSCFADADKAVGVLLPGKDGLGGRKAGGRAQNAVVFPHVFRLVSAVRAEVEGGQRALTHAADGAWRSSGCCLPARRRSDIQEFPV